MRTLICFLVCAIHINCFGQMPNYEQSAFDYFFSKVFPGEFPDTKTVQFSGNSESELSKFGFVKGCFEDTINVSLERNAAGILVDKKPIKCDCAEKYATLKHKKVNSGLTLFVLRDNVVNELHYVLIELHEENKNTFMYIFEMDNHGKVMKWCKTGLIH